jgi:hypothetical protein
MESLLDQRRHVDSYATLSRIIVMLLWVADKSKFVFGSIFYRVPNLIRKTEGFWRNHQIPPLAIIRCVGPEARSTIAYSAADDQFCCRWRLVKGGLRLVNSDYSSQKRESRCWAGDSLAIANRAE